MCPRLKCLSTSTVWVLPLTPVLSQERSILEPLSKNGPESCLPTPTPNPGANNHHLCHGQPPTPPRATLALVGSSEAHPTRTADLPFAVPPAPRTL